MFCCRHCLTYFVSKSSLNRHVRTHHDDTDHPVQTVEHESESHVVLPEMMGDVMDGFGDWDKEEEEDEEVREDEEVGEEEEVEDEEVEDDDDDDDEEAVDIQVLSIGIECDDDDEGSSEDRIDVALEPVVGEGDVVPLWTATPPPQPGQLDMARESGRALLHLTLLKDRFRDKQVTNAWLKLVNHEKFVKSDDHTSLYRLAQNYGDNFGDCLDHLHRSTLQPPGGGGDVDVVHRRVQSVIAEVLATERDVVVELLHFAMSRDVPAGHYAPPLLYEVVSCFLGSAQCAYGVRDQYPHVFLPLVYFSDGFNTMSESRKRFADGVYLRLYPLLLEGDDVASMRRVSIHTLAFVPSTLFINDVLPKILVDPLKPYETTGVLHQWANDDGSVGVVRVFATIVLVVSDQKERHVLLRTPGNSNAKYPDMYTKLESDQPVLPKLDDQTKTPSLPPNRRTRIDHLHDIQCAANRNQAAASDLGVCITAHGSTYFAPPALFFVGGLSCTNFTFEQFAVDMLHLGMGLTADVTKSVVLTLILKANLRSPSKRREMMSMLNGRLHEVASGFPVHPAIGKSCLYYKKGAKEVPKTRNDIAFRDSCAQTIAFISAILPLAVRSLPALSRLFTAPLIEALASISDVVAHAYSVPQQGVRFWEHLVAKIARFLDVVDRNARWLHVGPINRRQLRSLPFSLYFNGPPAVTDASAFEHHHRVMRVVMDRCLKNALLQNTMVRLIKERKQRNSEQQRLDDAMRAGEEAWEDIGAGRNPRDFAQSVLRLRTCTIFDNDILPNPHTPKFLFDVPLTAKTTQRVPNNDAEMILTRAVRCIRSDHAGEGRNVRAELEQLRDEAASKKRHRTPTELVSVPYFYMGKTARVGKVHVGSYLVLLVHTQSFSLGARGENVQVENHNHHEIVRVNNICASQSIPGVVLVQCRVYKRDNTSQTPQDVALSVDYPLYRHLHHEHEQNIKWYAFSRDNLNLCGCTLFGVIGGYTYPYATTRIRGASIPSYKVRVCLAKIAHAPSYNKREYYGHKKIFALFPPSSD